MVASESKNALVLLSGGIDSSACLVFYLAQGFSISALFVDYGQVSKGRGESAPSAVWSYCKRLGVPVELTYSCEMGKDQPCGKCLSCKDLEKLYAAGEE